VGNANNKDKKEKQGFWMTVASFIVDKRKAIIILFVIAAIYCAFNMNRVNVNQDITSYLPATSETRIGLTAMEEQFMTYGSARVMVCNITYQDAEELVSDLEEIEGVKAITFEKDKDHYNGSNALFDVTVTGGDDDPVSIKALNTVEEMLSSYDVYVSSSVGAVEKSMSSLQSDMNMILVLAVLIIVAVLFISTKAFMEIPVLLITFGSAALLNKGTNFWFGEISSVTDSIAVVLQLALAIDYAIILCDRYMEEHETLPPVEACKVALSKAIPEISSSSLTTVSGMAAMMFMQFKLGMDMGMVLVKAILFSLVAVFFLMPGIILIFAKGIDKTMHKSYVPKISFVGKFASLTKYFIPPVFLLVIIGAFYMSSNCTYLYDVDSVPSATLSESKIAKNKINSIFGTTNQLVVMVPTGDYEKEAKLAKELESKDYVISVTALANSKVNDDYMVTDKLNPRQFSELTDLDIEIVRVLYMAYAYSIEQYGPVVTGIDDYSVPILDMFLFLYEQYQEGYVTLSSDLDETLTELYDTLHDGEIQLKGTEYIRMVLNFDMPVEGEATYEKMDEIRAIADSYYGEGATILVGNSTSAHDLASSFAKDNIIISVLTALFVLIILIFTFQSAGLPVLLVATIQGSIWINFTVPALENQGIYFIAYLIVSAIQMGATIDYAIVISSRYLVLKTQMSIKEAITETLNQAFPTIFTSGTILTCAGFLIGEICSDATVAAIGVALGRGTLISIILVLFVLPQILLLGDTIIEKTALTVKLGGEAISNTGRIAVNGLVRGEFNGRIDGEVRGIMNGSFEGSVETNLPGRHVEVEKTEQSPSLLPPKKTDVLILLLASALVLGLSTVSVNASEIAKEETVAEEQQPEIIHEINTADKFLEYVEEWQYDAASLAGIYKLTADIDLTGKNFNGVPYFRGTLNGDGHTIKGVNINAEGTDIGFFRYVGNEAIVMDLKIEGSVNASGTAKNVGGIVGNNKGFIINCSFKGTVAGNENVGGIVGINRADSTVTKCENYGIVLATTNTGGIVGENEGLILKCKNYGAVNTDEYEATMDLGGVDLGTLNVTANVATRNNMGGIAGISSHLITSCTNYGAVGFDHSGYNVGGIAGDQSGIILKSTNNGTIKGRKDVGGIVGQAEPYVESEYLNTYVEETQSQIDDLNNTLTGINSTVRYTSSKSRKYAENMTKNANTSMDQLSDDLTKLTDSVSEEYPEAQEYADNINQAVENISNIDTSGVMSSDDIKEVQQNLNVISTNLSAMQGVFGDTGSNSAELLNNVSNELKNSSSYDDANNMVKTIDNGIQSVTNSLDKAADQIQGIRDTINSGFSVVTGDEQYISDISSIETAKTMDGVISGCINHGKVLADLNAGGIAGSMNLEYSQDPEFDLDFTETMSVVLRSTVNNVVIDCKNYGRVSTKKNCAGGVAGLQNLGLIYNSEGYGNISSESGCYLGGIVGSSECTVQSCYSLCTVSGSGFLGGIAGLGYAVTDCVSIPVVNGEGEALGAIVGWLNETSGASGNYFVSTGLGAIDNINYLGAGDELTYEEAVALPTAPAGFNDLIITFECEDKVVETRKLSYGGSIDVESFPGVESKEGYYIDWNTDSDLSCVKENLVLTAEYIPWNTCLAGEATSGDGKSLFLVVGEFTDYAKITMQGCSFNTVNMDSNHKLAYSYDWSVSETGNGEYANTVEGHFLIPTGADSGILMVKDGERWIEAKTESDGSYIKANIPVGASFALVAYYKPAVDYTPYIIVGSSVLLALIFVLIAIKVFKKHKKAKEKEKID